MGEPRCRIVASDVFERAWDPAKPQSGDHKEREGEPGDRHRERAGRSCGEGWRDRSAIHGAYINHSSTSTVGNWRPRAGEDAASRIPFSRNLIRPTNPLGSNLMRCQARRMVPSIALSQFPFTAIE